MISRDRRRPSVVILVADGARPDTLGAALDAGTLPALARLRAEGSFHTVTTVFPSVTGPAYAPFLMGRFPGPVGLPALRWFDRARTATWWPHFTRSYVGSEMRKVDRDLDPAAPTLFETGGTSLAALNVIGRGLPRGAAEGRSLGFTLRAAKTHFSGDVRGWLAIDRDIGATVAERIRVEQPDVTFCALTGIDKTSHAGGHLHPDVTDAMRIVDGTAAWIRDDAERDGRWETMQMMIVSDHGHSPVRQHDDLAALIAVWGYGVRAHPFVIGSGRDVAVMVSGNAMAHVYCDLDRTGRLFWPDVAAKFTALAERLLERPSVDLMLLPTDERRTEIRARGRGYARLVLERGRYAYRPETGDPLGIGHHEDLTADAAWDVTSTSDYPDALVQIAHLAGSARVGEIILSAARDWDLRARYEPIPHVSSHGALHRAHMLVPLITSRPTVRTPRRTVDVMPSALTVLGRRLPATLDGVSFF